MSCKNLIKTLIFFIDCPFKNGNNGLKFGENPQNDSPVPAPQESFTPQCLQYQGVNQKTLA